MNATYLIFNAEYYDECMYFDERGLRRICSGFILETESAPRSIGNVSARFSAVYDGGCLNFYQCKRLLFNEVEVARKRYQHIYGDSITCECAKEVLIDMSYNLGKAELASLTDFNDLMKAGWWDKAADYLRQTLYCKQEGNGNRCNRNQEQIRLCNHFDLTDDEFYLKEDCF